MAELVSPLVWPLLVPLPLPDPIYSAVYTLHATLDTRRINVWRGGSRPRRCRISKYFVFSLASLIEGQTRPPVRGSKRNSMAVTRVMATRPPICAWGRRASRPCQGTSLLPYGTRHLQRPSFRARPRPGVVSLATSDEGSDENAAGSDDGVYRLDLNSVEGASRRSMLVSFTCNACGGRSERLVNPLAWAKGMVIVQCEQCKAWHKIADSQNMVEEYIFNSDDE